MDKFKLPNKLFRDLDLSRAARLVGSVLYAYRNAFGVCRKSGSELAELARISPDVISSAMQELQRAGYITVSGSSDVAAGNQRRAFPSISRLQEMTGCARSTVCKALQALRQLPELLIRHCQKRNRAFSSNSYYFCTVLQAAVRAQKISSSYQFQSPAPVSAPARCILSAALRAWPRRITLRAAKIQVTLPQVRGSPMSRLLS